MTQFWSWRGWLPPRPAVPPLLWATLGAGALAVLNLIFYAEIWTRGQAGEGTWAAALGLALLAGPQVALVLWQWPPPVAAPFWVRWLWRMVQGAAAALGVVFTVIYFWVLIMMLLIYL